MARSKTCNNCKEPKWLHHFYKASRLTDGHMSWCKVCHNALSKKSRSKNNKYRKRQAEWFKVNKKKLALRRFWLKAKVISNYGTKCVCCGEDNIHFLCIDHINNDGAKHRKMLGGSSILLWLKKNNYPPGFQILCYNCNCAKRFHEVCPHLKAKQTVKKVLKKYNTIKYAKVSVVQF